MNKSMIRYLLSKLLLIEAVLLLVPVAIAVYYR
ncbi:TrkH family potassium uptake protein, partial [Streptococcus pneumoniae]|nr:TrkH family potassium uptake protein [Streptococcus pneumoniae]